MEWEGKKRRHERFFWGSTGGSKVSPFVWLLFTSLIAELLTGSFGILQMVKFRPQLGVLPFHCVWLPKLQLVLWLLLLLCHSMTGNFRDSARSNIGEPMVKIRCLGCVCRRSCCILKTPHFFFDLKIPKSSSFFLSTPCEDRTDQFKLFHFCFNSFSHLFIHF